MTKKICPVCGEQKWNYDHFAFGHTFCGNCYEKLRMTMWTKLRGSSEFINCLMGTKPYPKKVYLEALHEVSR
jgi:hypothetical protein